MRELHDLCIWIRMLTGDKRNHRPRDHAGGWDRPRVRELAAKGNAESAAFGSRSYRCWGEPTRR